MDLVMFEDAFEGKEEAIKAGPKLDELPGEILSMIAEEMTNEELRQLRELYNRRITHHIDYIFAEAHFSYRICKVTNRSVNHLRRLSAPRFLKHMRAIDIRLDLHCRIQKPTEERSSEPEEPLTTGILDEAKFFAIIEDVIRQAPKLRAITIRAPGHLTYKPGSLMVGALLAHDSPIHDIGLLRADLEYIQSNHGALPMRSFVNQILRRILAELPCLESIRIIGFAGSYWQSNLASARCILEEMTSAPALRNLTHLDLQLDMFPQNNGRCISSLVKVTERNVSLKVLRIHSGPNVSKNYRKSSDNWAPLLRQLGLDPPFRLERLELDGLVTSQSAPTLDQIIRVHSPTLRRVILHHTNFHFPNTLRAFFYALADSSVNYYEQNWLYIHRRATLVTSTLSQYIVPDEILYSDFLPDQEDEPFCDWVHITWDTKEDTPLIYSNQHGWYGKDWMRDRFLDTISSINCGIIRDS